MRGDRARGSSVGCPVTAEGGLVSGPQIREGLERYASAFLAPDRHDPEEAYMALMVVLHAYARGSRTARRLMEERKGKDRAFALPSKSGALRAMSCLSSIRTYLPHLLGSALASPGLSGVGLDRG